MNIALWLQRTAQQYPDRPAIALGREVLWNYRGFAESAARFATWLRTQGLAPGDRVALFMYNTPDYLPLMWGAWWAGVAVVPINAKLHAKEAAFICSHSGSKIVFCGADARDELEAVLRDGGNAVPVLSSFGFLRDASIAPSAIEPRSDTDPVWMFYTSGTTGRPKGVNLSLRQLRWTCMGYLSSVQALAPGDVALHPAPMSHGGGLFHLPYVMQAGLNVVPESGGFDAQECFDLAAHWTEASFFAAPTMVRRLIDVVKKTGQRPTGLATICYGGGPMYLADLEEALELIGPHFAQIYGQGECPMMITVMPRALINDPTQPHYRERLASVGFAQSMVEVAVVDAQGRDVPTGETGEIRVRGEAVMNGYWDNPDATAASIVDGWLYTGDVGRLDEDGFLTLLDRSKDLIISGGSNIYPREVEEALLTHDSVAEVAVIGRPDPEWGEVVIAFVVTRQPMTSAELDAHCLTEIARFKRPKHYRFVDELPKNNYGKVLKTALREMDAQPDAQS
ncbi:AMP-binding protein [Methyloversatilis sp.]|uniref:AMP-binding protein n=1 Tax=Methyloversatilis sp. TaxID=2569862 RepID=UPI002732FF81|nr:AMP-binding protein [Methyloversatilis sp.]MDP2869112.1 AMP-binding protein [Methyloversatilis sp.]MDP3454424.1 AMP-binding protein [Methyloversatilis sp.]